MKQFIQLEPGKTKLVAITVAGILLNSCSHKLKETFLLPTGFQGRITVIFNQPNFQPIPIEYGRKIYRIPADGILITSSKFESGYIDQQYYYLDNNGNKSLIPIRSLNSHELPANPEVVDHGMTGVYGHSYDPNPLNFIQSVVACQATSDSVYRRSARKSYEELIKKKVGRRF